MSAHAMAMARLAGVFVEHNHTEYMEGCFRCDLSRDETTP